MHNPLDFVTICSSLVQAYHVVLCRKKSGSNTITPVYPPECWTLVLLLAQEQCSCLGDGISPSQAVSVCLFVVFGQVANDVWSFAVYLYDV